MILKPGVRILGIKPETWAITMAADPLWMGLGLPYGVTVSSGTEGRHTRASKHYAGLALDLRISDLPAGTVQSVAEKLAANLGADFTVLLESDHIHGHYEPKDPMK